MQEASSTKKTGPRRSNRQRSEETRSLLVATARTLFQRKGYAETGTPEIVAMAQVTRGALYHHFDGKPALFLAVALQAAEEVATAIEQRSHAGASPLDNLLSGANAYFSAMACEQRATLLLQQAPAVLSPQDLLLVSNTAGSSELKEGLLSILPPVHRETVLIDALTALVSAAFDRAALEIANGGSAVEFEAAMRLLLQSLATD